MQYVIAIFILVTFSAYFSATETAFTSANRIRLKNMANDGNRKARKALELSENYDTLLSTILVGNNIVNIAASSIGTVLFLQLYPVYGATIATVVITVVVLIFGEISPKSIAKEKAESFAMFSAPILRFFIVILRPVNWIFSSWKKLLSRIFHVDENKPITEDELLTIVEEAETEGGIDEGQSELIQNAIAFHDLEAWDCLLYTSYSIANGIGIGSIAYTIIRVFTGKFEKKDIMVAVIGLLFCMKFIFITM